MVNKYLIVCHNHSSIEDAKLVDGDVPESYEIGADYANQVTKEVTPGEQPSAQPIDSKEHKA